jgi:hypothetical protein
VLRTFDAVPFVIVTRRSRWQSEKNVFDLGRDHERGRIKELTGRLERCETLVRQLEAGRPQARPSGLHIVT